MANTKHLEAFIDKMIKEANEAAQKVYDSYEPELIKKIQALLHEKHVMTSGMGLTSIENIETKSYVLEGLAQELNRLNYPGSLSNAAPMLPFKITKHTVND